MFLEMQELVCLIISVFAIGGMIGGVVGIKIGNSLKDDEKNAWQQGNVLV